MILWVCSQYLLLAFALPSTNDDGGVKADPQYGAQDTDRSAAIGSF
jgi:hypothetical protein